jgi:hypothetical protein
MNDETFSPLAMARQGMAPEVSVSRDIVKRGAIVAPVLVLVNVVFWGSDGAAGGAVAIVLVLANFALSAFLISVSAPISLGLMMAATLFGYLIRLGILFLAVYLLKDADWLSLPALGITLIVTHLGLLFWEMKYVAASLAFPGLRPNRQEWNSVPGSQSH